MTTRKDLTRWNRSGLSRFDYVDGNAVEYMEILRQQLVRLFADPETGECDWIVPSQQIPTSEAEPQTETVSERRARLGIREQRLLATYYQDRRDWAWEISRSFARSCHILSEYMNAYSNEGFLGTATQWENVRRLVELLDYHPAPPASATAWISLQAVDGAAGVIDKGFQVKNSPKKGEEKVIFESLEAVAIDATANQLRPKGWNVSPLPLHGSSTSGSTQTPVMQMPAVNIQDIGPGTAIILNSLVTGGQCTIEDLLTVDITDSTLSQTRFNEWRAKATFLSAIRVQGDWSLFADKALTEIVAMSAPAIAAASGNSLELAEALKQTVAMIDVCLDHDVFATLLLKEVTGTPDSDDSQIRIEWPAPKKPAVEAGQVALIKHTGHNLAEAVSISRVDELDKTPAAVEISIAPSALQHSWGYWPQGQTRLQYAARWHKNAWLNGADVIRTNAAHGLKADDYIGWKVAGNWRYARVLASDKLNVRLSSQSGLPYVGAQLFKLNPIYSNQAAADQEVLVMLGSPGIADAVDPVENANLVLPSLPSLDHIFTIADLTSASSSISLPPLLPPGALPGIGSFLLPTPFLPIDLVKAAVELMLNLGVMIIPSTGEIVIKGLPFGGLMDGISDLTSAGEALYNLLAELAIPDTNPVQKLVNFKVSAAQAKTLLTQFLADNLKDDTPLFQQVKADLEQTGPLLAVSKQASYLATVVNPDPLYIFDGKAERIQLGDWIVAEFAAGHYGAKITEISPLTLDDGNDAFALRFETLPSQPGKLKRIHADFRGELQPYQAEVNLAPIDPDNFELDSVPASLKYGYRLLVTGCGDPYVVKIIEIDEHRIVTEPPLRECLAGNMLLHGNVVQFGHGESKPQKILGSGDATQTNQSFTLSVADIAFIPDPSKTSGVAAAIEVEVDGQIWQQVSTLRDSVPDDAHFEIRMTEEGYLKLLFGDGRKGRRLPTGQNNVRARYRVGSGLVGNVPANSLVKAVKTNPLIEQVSQPIQASGGGDMEDLSSLRTNAPPSTLTLKRAVSLSDFAHLAASQSSIWQAQAYKEVLHGGRMTQVIVYVVPADGIFSEEVKTQLETYLQKQSLPGVQVTVKSYQPLLVDLKITVRVDFSAFRPDEIAAAVEAELISRFSLKNRQLGKPFYLSEVYRVVESMPGVENSICVLNTDEQVVKPESTATVVYLDTALTSQLVVNVEELRS